MNITNNFEGSKNRMHGELVGFVIWGLLGAGFVILGICEFFSKKEKPFGFWANAEIVSVKDVKKYNRALGKLWIVFGIVFTLLGLPLLAENPAWLILSILGCLPLCIGAMIVYTLGIEKKYRKK